MVRVYINFVMEALSDLDVTLKDEEKLVGYVYNYASQILMDFWDCNAFFFYGFIFQNFLCELKEHISNEHNSTKIFDNVFSYLLENVN